MTADKKADRLIGIVAGVVIVAAIAAGAVLAIRGDDSSTGTASATTGDGTAVTTSADEACTLDVLSATIAVRGPVVNRLNDAGATIGSVAPAADIRNGGAVLEVLESGSTIDCGLTTGRLVTRGGLRFDVSGLTSEIDDLVLDFDAQTMSAAVSSSGIDGRLPTEIDTSAVKGIDRGEELRFVIPATLLPQDSESLDPALRDAVLTEDGPATDATLTILAATNTTAE